MISRLRSRVDRRARTDSDFIWPAYGFVIADSYSWVEEIESCSSPVTSRITSRWVDGLEDRHGRQCIVSPWNFAAHGSWWIAGYGQSLE